MQISGNTGLLTWELSNGTLTIQGKNAVLDYECSKSWETYKNFITSVVIENGIKSIGQNTLFEGES